MRPAYQGRNPISDVFSLWALRQTVKYLPRVAKDPSDREALSAMLLGSTFAGIGACFERETRLNVQASATQIRRSTGLAKLTRSTCAHPAWTVVSGPSALRRRELTRQISGLNKKLGTPALVSNAS